MRYLIVLLLAATASASLITNVYTDLPHLDITGQNLQSVTVEADDHFGLDIHMASNGVATGVSVLLTGYVTVTGGYGQGTMFADPFQQCFQFPTAEIPCSVQRAFPMAFTFGVPSGLSEHVAMGVSASTPFASGSFSGPRYFSVLDSLGNSIDATITYSSTAGISPDVASVSNPEPGTWSLALVAAFAVVGRRGLSALRQPRPSRA